MNEVNKVGITPSQASTGLKNIIVARQWLKSQDGTRMGRIVINQDLPLPLVLPQGSYLNTHLNEKRAGMNDHDITISILAPVEEANKIIAQSNANREKRLEAMRNGQGGQTSTETTGGTNADALNALVEGVNNMPQ